jgi:hypothetical protein
MILSTWGDADGEAIFPAQQQVAVASKTSLREVQRVIRKAKDEGWLRVRKAPAVGRQGWMSFYDQ